MEKGGEILFFPSNIEPFLTSSFGLSPFVLQKTNMPSGIKTQKEVGQRGFLKYAAALLLFFTTTILFTQTNVAPHLSELGVSFFNSKAGGLYTYQKQSQANLAYNLIDSCSEERKVLGIIQNNPIKYYIIIGSFSSKQNAEQLLFDFKTKKEIMVLTTTSGLYRVSYKSYKDKSSALQELANIKSTIEENAWILTQIES